MFDDRRKQQWNDGPSFEAHLSDPWAPHPIVNSPNVCDGGGGKGKGAGIGGLLGDVAGILLAPETGGLSLAIPAIAGAGGSLLGSAVTGQPINPLGVIGSAAAGALGGGLGAGQDVLGLGTSSIGGAPAATIGATSSATGAGGATAAGAANPFGASLPTDAGTWLGTGGGGSTAGTLGAGTATDVGSFALSSGAAGDSIPGGALAPASNISPDLAAFSSAQGGGFAAPSAATSALPAATPTVASGGTSVLGGGIDLSQVAPVPASSLPGGAALPGQLGTTGLTPGAVANSGLPGGGLPGFDVAASGAVTPQSGGLFDFLGGNSKWLLPALGGGNVLKQLLAPSSIPGQPDLSSISSSLRNLGSTLQNNTSASNNIASEFGTGGLTQQQQTAFDQQLAGQIAAIKAKYAQLGLTGSTAELQDVQAAQNNIQAAIASAQNQNATTALNAVNATNSTTTAAANVIGAAAQPINSMAQAQMAQDSSLSSAVTNLATVGILANA